jgi:hypothetical protein
VPPPVGPGDAGLSYLAQPDQIPWLGQTILITKVKHPFKGREAVVKDVLCSPDSGLRIVAQLSHWDPTIPFQTIILDYNDVVEAAYTRFHINQKASTDYLYMIGPTLNYTTSEDGFYLAIINPIFSLPSKTQFPPAT